MLDLQISLSGDIALFLVSALVIAIAGAKAAGLADQLADRTGLGEALTGTLLLGLLTALPGLVASVVAASKGLPALAISNAIGGIAIQTSALAVADIAYRRANLEHAAASVANMMQATMLILLLVLVLLGLGGPDVTIGHVHPVTLVLALASGFAFRLIIGTQTFPMWRPTHTDETVVDRPETAHRQMNLPKLVAGLLVAAGLTAVSGALVAEAAENIIQKSGLSEIVVGGLLMAVATSLPELVTSVAAVRRGALTLAVSDIVGGNFFDVLFVAAADVAYINGSLYHAPDVSHREVFLTGMTILLNVILLAGLIYRQKSGPGNIGFESLLMLIVYVVGFLIVSLAM